MKRWAFLLWRLLLPLLSLDSRKWNKEGNGTPLQYSCLKNPMDGGAWWAAVHGVTKSRTRLSYFTFTFQFHELDEEMATHSSVLAWRIPGTRGPGGLPSVGLHRVGHNWSDLAAAAESGSHSVVSDFLWSMDYTVDGILQARILEWVAFSFSRGSSQPRDRTQVSCIAGGFFVQLSHKGSPRILEWVAYPFASGSSWPRIRQWKGSLLCFSGGSVLSTQGNHCYECLLCDSWQICSSHICAYVCMCDSAFFVLMMVCVHARSLPLCPTLCNPMDCSPPGSLCPWDAPGKNTGVGCSALLQGMFPTQGSNLHLFHLPALAGGFFTANTTWEALMTVYFTSFRQDCMVPFLTR